MKQSSSTIITASLVDETTLNIQAEQLLAHSGHSHSSQKDSQDKEIIDNNQLSSPKEVQPKATPQMSSEEKNFSNQQNTIREQPAQTESEIKIVPTASPETTTVEPAASANIIPILGESLLVLLLASPFLLIAFKRWFHK